MATKVIDARGLECPAPQLKMVIEVLSMKAGDILEVTADCSTFESDVRSWCQRTKKALILMKNEGAYKRCQVRV